MVNEDKAGKPRRMQIDSRCDRTAQCQSLGVLTEGGAIEIEPRLHGFASGTSSEIFSKIFGGQFQVNGGRGRDPMFYGEVEG
jgi:hypothetical protein